MWFYLSNLWSQISLVVYCQSVIMVSLFEKFNVNDLKIRNLEKWQRKVHAKRLK